MLHRSRSWRLPSASARRPRSCDMTSENPRAGLSGARQSAARFFSDYGMLAVLLLLVVFFSLVTIEKRKPVGAEAAQAVARQISGGQGTRVLVVGRTGAQDAEFVT